MKVIINYDHADDYDWEEVSVEDEQGNIIASLHTASDTPEDNSCLRMDVSGQFAKLATALGATVEYTEEKE